MKTPETLPDPAPATARDSAFHWRRFRRLMLFMVGIAVIAVVGSLWLLHSQGTVLHPHFVIALGLGISVSLLLAGALMGLVFVSADSGYDDTVGDIRPPDSEPVDSEKL